VSQEVRDALFDIASTMEIDEQAAVRGTLERTPAYVLAGGENAAGPWRLELRPSTSAGPAANVQLAVISPEGGGAGAGDFTVPADTPIEQAGGDPTFGAVTKEASGVELRLEEGTPPIPAQVLPLPPTMPFDFDLFFASNDADVQARAVAIGLDASSPDQLPSTPVPPPTEAPDEVTLEGTAPGIPWSLTLTGTSSASRPCLDFDTRLDFTPWCPAGLPTDQPSLAIWNVAGVPFAVGSVPEGLTDVYFDSPTRSHSTGTCTAGPETWNGLGACVIELADLEDGVFVFSGANDQLSISLDRETRQLPYNSGGEAVTASGAGEAWVVEQLNYREGLRVEVDGRIQSFGQPTFDDPVVIPYPDRPYDALLLVLTDLSVDQIEVISEGGGDGRWMPSATASGEKARLWIVELFGAGGGGLSYDGRRVGAVSWP
jgi:hypothetical protein